MFLETGQAEHCFELRESRRANIQITYDLYRQPKRADPRE